MRHNFIICLLLAGFTLGIYWPVSRLGFISYDDPDYITNNPKVRSGINPDSMDWALTSTHAGNWHPVTWLSHMLDCQIFGLNPGAFHGVNLAIHIVNSLLLFIVLRKMTQAVWGSALVAALFAWHPAHVQSVAWISERKDVLSGFFFLLTLWFYLKYAERVKVQKPNSKIFLGASLAMFALGLMSKPMLVTLPAILLLLDLWPLGRIPEFGFRLSELKKLFQVPSFRLLLLEKIPFVGLSLASVAATFQAQGGAGCIIPADQLSLATRLANVPVFCTAYLGKLFWPAHLAIFYPYRQISLGEHACAILLLTLVTIVCLRWRQTRPWCLTGWCWFLIMLLPVIGIVQVGAQAIADRYTYLPAIGIFILLAWSLGEIAAISRWWRAGVVMVAVALLLASLLDTRFQLRYWRDSITLARHSIEVTRKNNFSSYFGLGNALMSDGELDDAVTNFTAALQTASTYPWPVDTFGTHHNFGCALRMLNRSAEAEAQFKAAVKLQPQNAFTRVYLADALADQGKIAEAEAEQAAAIQLMPENPLLLQKIEINRSLTKLREDLKTGPTPKIHADIAEIETREGKSGDAVNHYRAALKLNPDSPEILNNLAWLLATCPQAKIRDGNLAVKYSQRACELTRFDNTMLLGTLAAAQAEAGKFDEAVATAQRACDLAVKNGETNLLQKNQELLERYRARKTAKE